MADLDLLSFDDALDLSQRYGGIRHVMLGNGFSIACRPETFSYGALVEQADFSQLSTDVRALFDLLETADFEKVIQALRVASDLIDTYDKSHKDIADRLRRDSESLKEALAQVLAARHPDHPASIADGEYINARRFLSNFERVYSVNYDLLLYWAVMKTELEPTIASNDGFADPGYEADYVTWDPYVSFTYQRIYYLHGVLHIFDDGNEIQKFTWNRTGIRLIDQIRSALSNQLFPLVVTEGSSKAKEEKILHSAYLTHALRSFSNIASPLFAFGHALSSNDEHILRRIEDGRIPALFVSVHGDPNSGPNQELATRASMLGNRRDASNPLTVHFFDSDSARVWT